MRAPCVFLGAALLLGSAGCATSGIDRRPSAQQIADLEGIYALSDGHRARLFGLDNRLYVTIDARRQKELLAAGLNRFASADGEVIIVAPAERSGDGSGADRILVEYVRHPGQHPPYRFASGPIPGRGYLD